MTIRDINAAIAATTEEIILDVKEGMARNNRNASYRLVRSLSSYVANGTGTVYALPYIFGIEKGTPPGKDPGLYNTIPQWVIDKGITEDPKEAVSIGWRIASSIEKYGTEVWKIGGEEVFSGEIGRTIDRLPERIIENINIFE